MVASSWPHRSFPPEGSTCMHSELSMVLQLASDLRPCLKHPLSLRCPLPYSTCVRAGSPTLMCASAPPGTRAAISRRAGSSRRRRCPQSCWQRCGAIVRGALHWMRQVLVCSACLVDLGVCIGAMQVTPPACPAQL